MSRNHRRDGPRGDRTENRALTGSVAETPRIRVRGPSPRFAMRAPAPPTPSTRRFLAQDFWVFVIGPVTGATVAAAYYKVINAMQDKEAENEPAADRADTDVKPVEA